MAGGVRKRLLEFYRRQQFRLRTKQQSIRIAIRRHGDTNKGLQVGFATLCVVDLFGVFPIIALPAALVSCGKNSSTTTYIDRIAVNNNMIKIRILWSAAADVRHHHSSVHGSRVGQMLDHCRETVPVDCDQEQVLYCMIDHI